MAASAAADDDVRIHTGGEDAGFDVANVAELAPSLPLETRYPPFPLRRCSGFWLPEYALPGVAAAHARFEPRPSDVFLATVPKSGTTWLKALAFATAGRAEHPPSGGAHPLRRRGPHDCVRFFEFTLAYPDGDGALAALPSPRLLSTHLPYSLLPQRVTADGGGGGSGCRIVYVCRDPKDTLVSWWLFVKKSLAPSYTIEEALEQFCAGRCVAGPPWHHALEYWEESRRRPEKVLFLRYEDMLRAPARHVRRLAEFMGCPFSGEEEAAGVADDVVELCSFGHLSSLEANKAGATSWRYYSVANDSFFRNGVAGDWSNHMSPEMAARLDGAGEEALRGTGFTFASSGESQPTAVADDAGRPRREACIAMQPGLISRENSR
ncbi:cytosolic sulfotransferase 12-like [Oryza brachyantha]|uniref:cytosolic sulfotransferase 12-like n=1 Tax=Oryza brachyantha TaxID=4533 RepID=UPI001ADD0B6F|nr:cytosolic sulfotransferase 12-like [Oryza brachyantha]